MAQSNAHQLIFVPRIENHPIVLNKFTFCSMLNDSFRVDRLKFYVSNVDLLLDGKKVGSLEKAHQLINFEEENGDRIIFDSDKEFDAVSFQLGIDSLTNVAGAMGLDLDPTNGMYWTWQSGYINLKLEGVCKSCPTRNNEFKFHLGGFQGASNAIQQVTTTFDKKEVIYLNIDLDSFLDKVDWENDCHIMSPGKEAVGFSRIISENISAKE